MHRLRLCVVTMAGRERVQLLPGKVAMWPMELTRLLSKLVDRLQTMATRTTAGEGGPSFGAASAWHHSWHHNGTWAV